MIQTISRTIDNALYRKTLREVTSDRIKHAGEEASRNREHQFEIEEVRHRHRLHEEAQRATDRIELESLRSGLAQNNDLVRNRLAQQREDGSQLWLPGQWARDRMIASHGAPLVLYDTTATANTGDTNQRVKQYMDLLSRSFKSDNDREIGEFFDVFEDRLSLASEGHARAFYFNEIAPRPAVLVYSQVDDAWIHYDALVVGMLPGQLSVVPEQGWVSNISFSRYLPLGRIPHRAQQYLKDRVDAQQIESVESLVHDAIVNGHIRLLLDMHLCTVERGYKPVAGSLIRERLRLLEKSGIPADSIAALAELQEIAEKIDAEILKMAREARAESLLVAGIPPEPSANYRDSTSQGQDKDDRDP